MKGHTFRCWICLILTLITAPKAQAQIAYWQKLLGGSDYDTGKKVLYLPDGTMAIGMQTRSQDGLGKGNHSEDVDVVIFKYATQEKVFWKTTIGGSGRDELANLIMTSDGGFICVGSTDSRDGDFEGNHGGNDLWVAKISPGGKLRWVTTLGGRGQDYGWCAFQDRDGSIYVGGESSSIDGDMRSPHHGSLDAWLAKLDANGDLLMEKHFGGPGNDRLASIQPHGKGLWLICTNDAAGGDVNINYGKKDLWLLNIDSNWGIVHQQAVGGQDNDDTHGSLIDAEGNLILAGTTFSNNGFISDQHGNGDGWLVKFDPAGRYLWSHAYGGTRNEGFTALTATHDGGYAMVGMTLSINGNLSSNEGYYDGWFLKTNKDGQILWSRNIGYKAKDALNDIVEIPSGGFLALGNVQEKLKEDIQIPGHHGIYDVWLVNFGDPGRGLDVRAYRTPSIMIGTVIDANTDLPLESAITLTDNRTLDSLTATQSDAGDGSFVLLLPSYGLVSINVLAQGYLFYGQDILTDSLSKKTSVERLVKLQPITVGSSLVLENIYFETAKWEVLKESYAELNRLVAFLELNPRVKIEIS
ncbi:MAG: hypothetical protein NWR72_17490, partial [Bacteroidia bacterium]|nr:hypothetical protein [Bacteroidia bacterium]